LRVEGLEDSFPDAIHIVVYGGVLDKLPSSLDLPQDLFSQFPFFLEGYGRRSGRKEEQQKEDGTQAEEDSEADFSLSSHILF
jgi:hypothetical protein